METGVACVSEWAKEQLVRVKMGVQRHRAGRGLLTSQGG
jgi:hypothetical protein